MKALALVLVIVLVACFELPPPQPTPSPTPSPTVEATPEPIPTPTPDPTRLPVPECRLPPQSNTDCSYNPIRPVFRDIVLQAQAQISTDWTSNPGQYTDELASLLRQWGYCAQAGRGIEDEVWVKNTNEFSEHYDVVTASGEIWTHFAARCAPPGF